MALAQIIQDAWNTQAKWLVVLRPLSWLYRLGFVSNHWLYRKGIKKLYRTYSSNGDWKYYRRWEW